MDQSSPDAVTALRVGDHKRRRVCLENDAGDEFPRPVEILTLGFLQMSREAGGLASSCQDRAEGRGQAAHSDPAQRDEGGRQAAVRHAAAEAQLLGGQQGFQDADEAKRRAAFGNEVHLVPVRTQVRRDLLQRPGPEQTRRTLRFGSRLTTLSCS